MRKETFKAILKQDCSFTIIPSDVKKLRLIRGMIPIDESVDKIKFIGTKELDVDKPFKLLLLKRWIQTDKGVMSIDDL